MLNDNLIWNAFESDMSSYRSATYSITLGIAGLGVIVAGLGIATAIKVKLTLKILVILSVRNCTD